MLGGMAALPGPEWSGEPPGGPTSRHRVSRLHPFHARPAHRCRAPTRSARVGGSRSIGLPRRACRRSTPRPSRPCSPEGNLLPPDPFFSGDGLDRADHLRADPVAICRCSATRRPGSSSGTTAPPQSTSRASCAGGRSSAIRPCSSASTITRRAFLPCPMETRRSTPARISSCLSLLDAAEAPTFAAALSLANWHRRHGHCSVCGTADRAQSRRLVASVRQLRRRTLSARRPGGDHACRA